MSTGVKKLDKAWKHLSSYCLLEVYFSFTGKCLGLGPLGLLGRSDPITKQRFLT